MKHTVLLLLITLSFFKVKAQVKDISVTFSPAAEYTWWDDQAGLADGALIGGKIGFGFGEFVELRGLYFQSVDLTTSFADFGLENYNPDLFTSQDVTLKRYGGEFKGNIGTKRLMPYVTLGTGVQRLELQGRDNIEQIYASVGLGIKLKIAHRAVFLLEAKNTLFNSNAGASLLTEENKTSFGVTDADFTSNGLSNWGVQGSLQFYLGGRRPGVITDLDRAYLAKFKGGLRGMQLIVEPSLNYITFDNTSQFRDTYLLGGYAGVDFNEYIGVRAFYLQATENETISTDFDNLALYGLEFRARLNDGNGVTPYLILGGGYMNSYGSYIGTNNINVKSSEFASGGLGLNIPLGKRLLITGGVRAMITSGTPAEDLTAPSDIQTHVMYNAGLKFVMGKKSQAPQDVYTRELNTALDAQQAANNTKIQSLKSGYAAQVDSLQYELKRAYEAKDVDKAIQLMQEKKEAQTALDEVGKIEALQETEVQAAKTINQQKIDAQQQKEAMMMPANGEVIRMTPAEFESLIIRILESLENGTEDSEATPLAPAMQAAKTQNIEKSQEGTTRTVKAPAQKEEAMEIAAAVTSTKTDPAPNSVPVIETVTEVKKDTIQENTMLDTEVLNDSISYGRQQKFLYYNSFSGMVGYNVGGVSTLNLGTRLHFDIRNTSLQFMPEAYIGLGKENTYGASGNFVYNIAINNQKVVPYVGAGLGVLQESNTTIGHYNVILGAQLPFLNKNLYIDYTMRNTFDYNQLALGYRIAF